MHSFARSPTATPLHLAESTTASLPLISTGKEAPVKKGHFCWIEFCQILKRVPLRSHPARSLFGNWSERKKEKLRAIMHYFKVVTDESETMRKLFPCVWSFQWMCVTSSLSHSPHPRHEARWAGDFRETLPPRHRYAKMEKVTFSAVSFFFCL